MFQEVLWGENWSVFRLARLVHRDAVSCSSGWPPGIPIRHVHSGTVPGQVNTSPLPSYKNSIPRAGIIYYYIYYSLCKPSSILLLFVVYSRYTHAQ